MVSSWAPDRPVAFCVSYTGKWMGLVGYDKSLGVVQLSDAVILHEGSTILVVLNALGLLRYKL